MALVTIHAVIDVPGHIGVMETGGVPAPMAVRTLENRIIVSINVAGRANAIRAAVVQREPRVVEGCARPCGRSMAGLARGRKSCGSVIGISRSLIDCLVA